MRGRIATTGVFDGVHRGHRHLLGQLSREAARRGLDPIAITFDRHPLATIAPDRVPPAITTPEARDALIRAEGVTPTVIPFDDATRRMTAAEFTDYIAERYGVRALILGFDNTIGADRLRADSPELRVHAEAAGMALIHATELTTAEGTVSSSRIRRAVEAGEMEAAARMLGRNFTLEGKVVTGRQLGRTIGFPTANIEARRGFLIPANGVYAARAEGGRPAVVNIGRRPTVERSAEAPLSIEAHLLDYDGDLYGRTLRVEFISRLRGEKKFANLEELIRAIDHDIRLTRELYSTDT